MKFNNKKKVKLSIFQKFKLKFILLLQNISLYILKKTNYKFVIEHDKIKIIPFEVSRGSRWDFLWTVNNHAYKWMYYLCNTGVINKNEIIQCPNKYYVEVPLNNDYTKDIICKSYEPIINYIKKSDRVKI